MLVLGAGGGIGLAAVDVAVALGARVVAAASSEEKLEAARRMGAQATVAYEHEDLKSRVRELTDGGVDVVVDPVGGRHSEPALRATKTFGRFCVIGFASGPIASIPLNHVLLNNRTVVGVDWGAWAMRDPTGTAPCSTSSSRWSRAAACTRPSPPSALSTRLRRSWRPCSTGP